MFCVLRLHITAGPVISDSWETENSVAQLSYRGLPGSGVEAGRHHVLNFFYQWSKIFHEAVASGIKMSQLLFPEMH